MTYFTFIFAFLITGITYWASISLIRIYIKVRNWQKVDARVLSKKVEMRKKRSNSGTAIYIPVIEYSYVINGTNYNGSKVYLEELLGGARSAREHQVEAKLKTIGEQFPVFVNSAHPTQSVMFRDGIGIYVFIMFLGTISFLVGISYLVSLF